MPRIVRNDETHRDRGIALIGKHGRLEEPGGLEAGEEEPKLLLRERRESPVGLEGVGPRLGEFAKASRPRYLPQRCDGVATAPGSVEGALPTLCQRGRHSGLVVDPTLLDLEARVLEEHMIVRRVLTQDARRKRLVGVHGEGEVEETESRASRDGVPAAEPLSSCIHQGRDRRLRLRQGLEHRDVAERLAPVALVATIDDGRGAGNDFAPVEGPKGTYLALLPERGLAAEDGEVEIDRRRPPRPAVGIHTIVEEHELLERVLALGCLDLDAHASPLESTRPYDDRGSEFNRPINPSQRARQAAWAVLGSNQWPPACKADALPLS